MTELEKMIEQLMDLSAHPQLTVRKDDILLIAAKLRQQHRMILTLRQHIDEMKGVRRS